MPPIFFAAAPPRRNCGRSHPPTELERVITDILNIVVGFFLLLFICLMLSLFLKGIFDCCKQKFGKKKQKRFTHIPRIDRTPTENWTRKFCWDVERYVTTLEKNGRIIHEQWDEELIEFVRNPCEKCMEVYNVDNLSESSSVASVFL